MYILEEAIQFKNENTKAQKVLYCDVILTSYIDIILTSYIDIILTSYIDVILTSYIDVILASYCDVRGQFRTLAVLFSSLSSFKTHSYYQ